MTVDQAIDLAQCYLESCCQLHETVSATKFIPANSLDPLDDCYQDDTWAICFDLGTPDVDPGFVMLHVNCRTRAVEVVPVL